MWSENTKNGKVRFVERYDDPLTGKSKKVSVVMDKDNRSTRKQAADILQCRINDALSSTSAYVKQDDITIAELVDLYRAYQKGAVVQSTYTRNYHAMNKIKKILGPDTLVCNLTAGYVKAMLVKDNDSPTTVNETIARFKAFIRWGYQNDYISDISYLDKIKKLPDKTAKEKLEHKYLEREELNLLLSAMRVPHWHNLASLMVLSGLRVGEAIALTSNDVDLKNKVIHVTKTYDVANQVVDTPKTPTSNRDVFIQPELEKLLYDIRKDTNKRKMLYGFRTNLFMCDMDGDYLKYYAFNRYLKRISLQVLGREITTHVLRHTHVSLLAESGVPLETITRRVGHEDSDITRRIYLHITKRMKERDNELVAKVSLL